MCIYKISSLHASLINRNSNGPEKEGKVDFFCQGLYCLSDTLILFIQYANNVCSIIDYIFDLILIDFHLDPCHLDPYIPPSLSGTKPF